MNGTDAVGSPMDAIETENEATPLYVWIGLSCIACVSFWCQAVVTEERFVPALNVIANTFNIPDDIAGATLMAAGASSPELFSSIVALFITHSALGLGTIVGSEIFNQLIICAGAVFASKSGKLQLDRAIVIREVSFYALAIILLYLALRDTRPVPGDEENHIFISFGEACMIFSGYILYVIVCANMDRIVHSTLCQYCCRKPAHTKLDSLEDKNQQPLTGHSTVVGAVDSAYGSINSTGSDLGFSKRITLLLEDMPFLRRASLLETEPCGNFVEFRTTKTGEKAAHRIDLQHTESSLQPSQCLSRQESRLSRQSVLISSLRGALSVFSDGNTLREFQYLIDTEKPSDEHNLTDIDINMADGRLSCFMWQRSYFYDKARFVTRGWHLRWFTLTLPPGLASGHASFRSVPDRRDYARHCVHYPISLVDEIEVDEQRLVVRLVLSPLTKEESESGNHRRRRRDFYFMAPSEEILEAFVQKLEEVVLASREKKEKGEDVDGLSNDHGDAFMDGDEHGDLIAFPFGGSSAEIILFVILSPLRFLMHYTIPDVRKLDQSGFPVDSLGASFLAVLACLIWLIVGSYAMVASLEALADLLDIPDAVVGVTVSAASTSLPNYVASKVAAENGFGNMAVSNAFGSNTFNIMVGLGLPWLLYTSFGTHFEPYHSLRDEGITQSVVILATVLLVFVVLIIPNNFTLYKWHGVLFIFLYLAYLTFSIGQVYW